MTAEVAAERCRRRACVISGQTLRTPNSRRLFVCTCIPVDVRTHAVSIMATLSRLQEVRTEKNLGAPRIDLSLSLHDGHRGHRDEDRKKNLSPKKFLFARSPQILCSSEKTKTLIPTFACGCCHFFCCDGASFFCLQRLRCSTQRLFCGEKVLSPACRSQREWRRIIFGVGCRRQE